MDCSDLKAGDMVVLHLGPWGREAHTVKEITKAGFIRVNGDLYRPRDGVRRGDAGSWRCWYITPGSAEEVEEIRKAEFIDRMLRAAHSLSADTLPYEKALELQKILEVE